MLFNAGFRVPPSHEATVGRQARNDKKAVGMTCYHGASISVAGTFGMLSGIDGAGVSITFIDFHFPWRNLFSRIAHITIANVVVNIHST